MAENTIVPRKKIEEALQANTAPVANDPNSRIASTINKAVGIAGENAVASKLKDLASPSKALIRNAMREKGMMPTKTPQELANEATQKQADEWISKDIPKPTNRKVLINSRGQYGSFPEYQADLAKQGKTGTMEDYFKLPYNKINGGTAGATGTQPKVLTDAAAIPGAINQKVPLQNYTRYTQDEINEMAKTNPSKAQSMVLQNKAINEEIQTELETGNIATKGGGTITTGAQQTTFNSDNAPVARMIQRETAQATAMAPLIAKEEAEKARQFTADENQKTRDATAAEAEKTRQLTEWSTRFGAQSAKDLANLTSQLSSKSAKDLAKYNYDLNKLKDENPSEYEEKRRELELKGMDLGLLANKQALQKGQIEIEAAQAKVVADGIKSGALTDAEGKDIASIKAEFKANEGESTGYLKHKANYDGVQKILANHIDKNVSNQEKMDAVIALAKSGEVGKLNLGDLYKKLESDPQFLNDIYSQNLEKGRIAVPPEVMKKAFATLDDKEQQSLVYMFGKSNDPASVIRSEEFQQYVGEGWFTKWKRDQYNILTNSNEVMSPETAEMLVRFTNSKYEASRGTALNATKSYVDRYLALHPDADRQFIQNQILGS